MAKRITEILVDDIDGTEIAAGAGGTVKFSFEGVNYEIDLTDEHVKEMREALSPYLVVARKTGNTPRSASRASARVGTGGTSNVKAMRTWLRAQGLEVSDRGRIPAALIAQYEAAH
ncbi:histone-like nucleoid-structuring protein Lsr2 [Leucobacter sp. W1478]|uniref:histone-like nucleoid-structuring protein Lsr2 n=1 Tax=Leucobacter sp. W1478 TaxID=3439065 RepID=UPI003F3D0F53